MSYGICCKSSERNAKLARWLRQRSQLLVHLAGQHALEVNVVNTVLLEEMIIATGTGTGAMRDTGRRDTSEFH